MVAAFSNRVWIIGIAALITVAVVARYFRGDGAPEISPPDVDLASASAGVRNAVEVARDAVVRKPDSASRWGHLGMLLLAYELDGEAIVCLKQAVALDPESFAWNYYLGLASAAIDEPLAIKSFIRASEIQPKDPLPKARLGEILLKRGRLQEANSHLEAAVANSDGADPRLIQALARVRLLSGDFQSAAELARKADAIAPGSRMILEVLARALLMSADTEDAERVTRQLQTLSEEPLLWRDPYAARALALREDESVLKTAARMFAASGRPETAIATLRNGITEFPKSVEMRIDLAKLLLQSNDQFQVVSMLEEARTLAPRNAEVSFHLGVAYFLQKRPTQAMLAFEHAVALKPDYVIALYNLAQCQAETGDVVKANGTLEVLLTIQPEHPQARLALATLLLESGRPGDAILHLHKLIQFDRHNLSARTLLEEALKQSTQTE